MTDGPASVLVVEDDEILRETLTEVVADEGHEVRAAENGHVALELIAEEEPDVIVLDLMMPVMDAFEFRRRQLANGLAPEARILILSAARGLDAAAREIAADAWLPKPFRLVEVIDAIERLARGPAAPTAGAGG